MDEEKKEEFRPIPQDRLEEILGILFPWGYSHYDETKYTGVSPYIGDEKNIITVVANDEHWGEGSVFAICMERFNDNMEEEDSLGFYKGIMKLIAPELYSDDDQFKDIYNVLDFKWSDDIEKKNAFNGKVIWYESVKNEDNIPVRSNRRRDG